MENRLDRTENNMVYQYVRNPTKQVCIKSGKIGLSWEGASPIEGEASGYLVTVCKISHRSVTDPSKHCVQQEADGTERSKSIFNVN